MTPIPSVFTPPDPGAPLTIRAVPPAPERSPLGPGACPEDGPCGCEAGVWDGPDEGPELTTRHGAGEGDER